MVDETVFDAFPHAIEQVSLYALQRSTIIGNVIVYIRQIDAIIDEGESTGIDFSATTQSVASDTLLYVKPAQMPTLDCSKICSDYQIAYKNKNYAIVDASLGKNQETGIVEHIELKIKQEGAIEDVSD